MTDTTSQPISSGVGNTFREAVRTQLVAETKAMARYALAAGLQVSPQLAGVIDEQLSDSARDAGALTSAHNELAKLVAPAKPGTIRILEDEKLETGIGRYLGPIRLIRNLVVASLLFLGGFVALATLTNAGAQSATSAGAVPPGWKSLWVILYLFAAAGLGATFAALWRVNRYVQDGTYDRTYDASYWIMILLGLIAGLVLAMVIPIKSVAGQTEFSKPLLALLGGFSASAVHRILTALVTAVESLVEGDPADQDKVKQEQAAAHRTAERTGIAAQLVTVEQALSNGGDVSAARSQLHALMTNLVSGTPVDSGVAVP